MSMLDKIAEYNRRIEREALMSSLEQNLEDLEFQTQPYYNQSLKKITSSLEEKLGIRLPESGKVENREEYMYYFKSLRIYLEGILKIIDNFSDQFKIGDEVKIVRTCGPSSDCYSHGGTTDTISLGTKGKILDIEEGGSEISMKIDGHYPWYCHPDELESSRDTKKLKEELKKYGSGKIAIKRVIEQEKQKLEEKEILEYETKRREIVEYGISKMESYGFTKKEIKDFFKKLNIPKNELKLRK